MSRSSPASDEREIDRVLRLKRNQNEMKACIPCRRRKVRCDKGCPCKTCQKRGHPLICAYDLGRQSPVASQISHGQTSSTARRFDTSTEAPDFSLLSRGSSKLGGQQEKLPVQSSIRTPLSTPTMQKESTQDYVFSGDNSIASIVRSRAQRSDHALRMNIEPVLGLQNTFSNYPFMDQQSSQNQWAMLLKILPQRSEVLKFFQVYKTSNYLFTPVLVDIDQFELDLFSYLNAYAAGELQGPNPISDRWMSGKSLGFISLILAVLAAGAHFSDIENPERSSICQDFEQRSFQVLRLANFLFRPSSDIIQTLLILGSTLQNTGQSNAAWAMLGTTVRLAQILGFHTSTGIAHLPEHMKTRAKKCWSNIVWQDALLSLCHDRPPVTSKYISTDLPGHNLSYTDVTDYICRLSLKVIDEREPEARHASPSIAALECLDNAYSRAQPHLQAQENCKTLHQHLERLALKMHMSFCIQHVCRPAIQGPGNSIEGPEHDFLRQRAKEGLIQASTAFLDFQALSTVPLRSWPMVHTALSSTLLLCVWEETRHDSECRDLQQKVIEVFAGAASTSVSDSQDWQWLSEGHARALVTLRNAFCDGDGVGLDTSTDQHHLEARRNAPDFQSRDELNLDGSEETSLFEPCNQLHNDSNYSTLPQGSLITEGLGLSYTSSLSYIDTIMNVPFIDFSQNDDFL